MGGRPHRLVGRDSRRYWIIGSVTLQEVQRVGLRAVVTEQQPRCTYETDFFEMGKHRVNGVRVAPNRADNRSTAAYNLVHPPIITGSSGCPIAGDGFTDLIAAVRATGRC